MKIECQICHCDHPTSLCTHNRISSFTGAFRFLSNFAPSPVFYDGVLYTTVEHAYQAAKGNDAFYRKKIFETVRPGDAKRLGRAVKLRPDWEDVKTGIMLDLLRQKFANDFLRELLLSTGDAKLIEGNHWGDTFWGVCNGVGQNMLGRLLMQVREEIFLKNLLTKEFQ